MKLENRINLVYWYIYSEVKQVQKIMLIKFKKSIFYAFTHKTIHVT